jgi:hypothetical protein
MMAAIFMYRTARYADDLKIKLEELSRVKMKMSELEADFGDKFDAAMRKFSSRENMRQRRQEQTPEDLNKPNGGIIGYGPTR